MIDAHVYIKVVLMLKIFLLCFSSVPTAVR